MKRTYTIPGHTTQYRLSNNKLEQQWCVRKKEYLRLLLRKYNPDLVFLSETKRLLVINPSELACDNTYRVVQIKSTETNRGGMIAIIRNELQLVTAEVLRKHAGNDFAQAIILTDKDEKAYGGWYNSPMMSKGSFKETLERLNRDHDLQFLPGDFNARDPRWCSNHDNTRRGTQLINFTRNHPEYLIHATRGPTFEATANIVDGTRRSSTVDLVLSRRTIRELNRETGYLATCSDHYPITFRAAAQLDVTARPRKVAKTLLQSVQLRKNGGYGI